MTDEFDTELSRSLHQRAAAAPTDGHHFGDVRRRVRRRRQRHVAMGVLPAMAGVAYLGTRPVADEPAQAGATPDSTVLTGLPSSTFDQNGAATSTTWPGSETTYRCREETAYLASDGWVYYTNCEQVPPSVIDGSTSVYTTVTVLDGSPTTTLWFGGTTTTTTTSQPVASLPVNVPTTTTSTTAP